MSDEEIKRQVTEQLLWDDRLQGSEIKVEFDEGVISLVGAAPNHYAKNAAENDALTVRGVTAVENKLRVETERDGLPSDDEVKERVKDAIYWNNRIDYSKIDALVNHHVVTLLGSVDAFWKADLAAELAYSVKGVISVINKLSVTPAHAIADEEIAGNIVKAMERSLDIDHEERIRITVEDGLVTLEGAVDTWRENNAAYTAALYTRGVKDIQNNIFIKPGYRQKELAGS